MATDGLPPNVNIDDIKASKKNTLDPEEINRLFNLAEQIVREWIALYLEVEVDELFTKPVRSDIISFAHESKTYALFVDLERQDADIEKVYKPLFGASETAREALNKLCRAVYMVFGPTVETIEDEKHRERMKNIHPSLEENEFRFRFVYSYPEVAKYTSNMEGMGKLVHVIQMFKKRIEETKANVAENAELVAEQKKLFDTQIKLLTEINTQDKFDIEKKKLDAEAKTASLFYSPRLYICLDDNYEYTDAQMYSRLPYDKTYVHRSAEEEAELIQAKKELGIEIDD